MIDIESEVFRAVKTAVTTVSANVFVTSEYVKAVEKFPCVTVIETSNTTHTKSIDSSGSEKYSSIAYEINVYSNKASGKKSECKSIISAADAKMTSLGFVRTMLNVIPNLEDATIFRMTARYTGVVSNESNKKIYWR